MADGIAQVTVVQGPPPIFYVQPRRAFFECELQVPARAAVAPGWTAAMAVFNGMIPSLVYADTGQPVYKPRIKICGGSCDEIGSTIWLKVRYDECTSRHQDRPFALKLEFPYTGAEGVDLFPPLIMGATVVKARRPKLPAAAPAPPSVQCMKVCTAEDMADARQRVAEERGEVCDLTEDQPPAKKPNLGADSVAPRK